MGIFSSYEEWKKKILPMNVFSDTLKSLRFRKTTACGCVITNLYSNSIADASPPLLVATQACLWYAGLGVH
jgi:hypothetical protein